VAKRPTIVDVARRAGVSTAVVSYALNGRPGVSAETRERVLRIAAECGWRPSAAARSLRAGPRSIGLVLPAGGGSFAGEDGLLQFVGGLQAILSSRRIRALLHLADNPSDAVEVCAQWWAEREVFAVVIPDVQQDDDRLRRLTALGIPVVGLEGPHGDPPADGGPAGDHSAARGPTGDHSAGGGAVRDGGLVDPHSGPPGSAPTLITPMVWSDDAVAFGNLAVYLLSLGHRRIARVIGRPELAVSAVRERAFNAAAERAGAVVENVLVAATVEAGAAATRRLLQALDRPTVIVYDDDAMAISALDVARRLDIDVPWELSVVAGADSVRCRLVTPSLTALARDIEEYGHAAGEQLLAILDGVPAGHRQVATAVLTVRGSTAPAAR
jgi:DNA-binding LacI/PurR family transcriptional regulator